MNEKLNKLKRFNIHGNGMVNDPHGKLVMFSQVEELLRDETAGASVVTYHNSKPDGNESESYTCIKSDKLNLCFTPDQIAVAKERFENKPWLSKFTEEAPVKAPAKAKPAKAKVKDGQEKVPKAKS